MVHYATNNHNNEPWLLDSGAFHYVTGDLNNLSMHNPYNGSYDIMIGDDLGLFITHTGSSFLKTSHNTFQLNNVLCFLTMKNTSF